MATIQSAFTQLENAFQQGGTQEVLQQLADQLLQDEKYHELFEARKMEVRHRLGLPLLYSDSGDELTDDQRDELEDGLISACREVGLALMKSGRLGEGWMYLRPAGEKTAAQHILAEAEVTSENMDEFVEIALQEGVHPARGYQMVLENYGTCNSITMFESLGHQLPHADQKALAELLLRHVHSELLSSLTSDISSQQGEDPGQDTLQALVDGREWLFGEHSYHIDTTHLASTVRFSRCLADPEVLRLALDLTHYGRCLSEQFQYAGDEPFADIYLSHALFFQALLGENLEEALGHFLDRAENVSRDEFGTAAAEVYVDLLARVGQHEEAIEASKQLLPPGTHTMGHAPSLLELSEMAEDYQTLLSLSREAEDLLGFATGLVRAGVKRA
tara:strand:+ start:627 stop:1793 length:1167 start_codon:yes stop_codon:yes gene_type:complete